MNHVLQLKGQFFQHSGTRPPGMPHLPVGASVTASHLGQLRDELRGVYAYWQTDHLIKGALVSVHYRDVVAKSNRIKGLLCQGSQNSDDFIRGARLDGDSHLHHIFTHYIMPEVLEASIMRLELSMDIVEHRYGGQITWENVEALIANTDRLPNVKLEKTNFLKVVKDAYYVRRFAIDRDIGRVEETSIVSLYRTDTDTTELLYSLGIKMIEARKIDDTTVRLDPDELTLLKEKAPYLIAMRTHDLRKITQEDIQSYHSKTLQIPSPRQEPVVGVIDTLFYEDVYFREWVSYTRMVDPHIETDIHDCDHGTAVTSIIVDGPAFNPELDDGCGRFRVRHFGVATKGRFSSFSILKAIREIIATNRDIKVWNLSLGSAMEINRNFISPEAAELDRMQSEYDIVFVVAGTNREKDAPAVSRIGAPADSINSIVVNAVDAGGKAASYHRSGPVLSFFHKPDVSYYGGDIDKKMVVCTPSGEGYVSGTSFAAPWITRKMAYLISVMGFSREVAKALLIDAAAGWERKDDTSFSIGYGVVPIRIERILQSPNDEIRFIISGSSDAYETYNHSIPIPIYKEKHPFFARATLCYYPKCSRDQGVDYTCTELDIHFGRVQGRDKGVGIKSINNNQQGDEGLHPLQEASARSLYRKWDNIKHINDVLKSNAKPRKVYGAGMWGLSIRAKERLLPGNGRGMPFGVVVTLKELYGENRIDDFIKACMMRGWIVQQIDIDNRLEIYAKAEDNITFE